MADKDKLNVHCALTPSERTSSSRKVKILVDSFLIFLIFFISVFHSALLPYELYLKPLKHFTFICLNQGHSFTFDKKETTSKHIQYALLSEIFTFNHKQLIVVSQLKPLK